MTTRLLLIESNLRSLDLVCLIQDLDGQICCERQTWDRLDQDTLLYSDAQLIVFDVAPAVEQSVLFLNNIGRGGFPIPTVAILPETADHELSSMASKAAADFVFQPIHRQEFVLRINRILHPVQFARRSDPEHSF